MLKGCCHHPPQKTGSFGAAGTRPSAIAIKPGHPGNPGLLAFCAGHQRAPLQHRRQTNTATEPQQVKAWGTAGSAKGAGGGGRKPDPPRPTASKRLEWRNWLSGLDLKNLEGGRPCCSVSPPAPHPLDQAAEQERLWKPSKKREATTAAPLENPHESRPKPADSIGKEAALERP